MLSNAVAWWNGVEWLNAVSRMVSIGVEWCRIYSRMLSDGGMVSNGVVVPDGRMLSNGIK